MSEFVGDLTIAEECLVLHGVSYAADWVWPPFASALLQACVQAQSH